MAFINGTEGSETLVGTPDDDYIYGDGGNDSIRGEGGNDVISNYLGGGNTVDGGDGDDSIYGSRGNDFFSGGNGNDFLDGWDGNDFLIGGNGNDTFNGGAGNDTFSGGSGSNSFVYYSMVFAPGSDVITDFQQFNTNSNAEDLGERDLIVLSQYWFGLSSDFGIGFSDSSEFEVVANDADAAFSNAMITFSRSTGSVFYNQNRSTEGFGNGGQLVTLVGVSDLTPDSFEISY
jgi:Ca2+-binding RTX toxin-like protein